MVHFLLEQVRWTITEDVAQLEADAERRREGKAGGGPISGSLLFPR